MQNSSHFHKHHQTNSLVSTHQRILLRIALESLTQTRKLTPKQLQSYSTTLPSISTGPHLKWSPPVSKSKPEGNTPSRLYVNGTLRSWLHYIELRSANGTQLEHIQLAIAVADAIAKIFPSVDNFIEK